jgi:hypothetical protein
VRSARVGDVTGKERRSLVVSEGIDTSASKVSSDNPMSNNVKSKTDGVSLAQEGELKTMQVVATNVPRS